MLLATNIRLVLFCRLLRERKKIIRFSSKRDFIVFTNFQHKKLYCFQNPSLGFIIKTFLEFRKFHPRYSCEIYSYKKKKE